ncbi:aluminum-activated malate transporter 13-like [Andrographis paniculata]|uniref:aluminum-activated malate transporter 13-like n=1 Tax=Andrographis paniculata TaxID=175694 RepID=UPI0021E863FE|nr:aluminum-activated malate transporter 13-like [Andrographis paniculata]
MKSIISKIEKKRVIHSFKVGLCLVLVSLLYTVDPIFRHVGENAIWAIMTVIVVFEFYAGATLGKGINRGIGTMVGGGIGCLVAILVDKIGGNGSMGKPIAIGISVFIFGLGATYCRLAPSMKKRYDYGFMIAILTFNLVVVPDAQDDSGKVVEVALDRLATIGMGFAVCILVSLFVFPMWAGDELHCSTATKFRKLADAIRGCTDEYMRVGNEKNKKESSKSSDYMQDCNFLLNSKSSDDSLANFAKWEPNWHGKFGKYYPLEKYLQIGDHLRHLAAIILALDHCLHSPKQVVAKQRRETLKETSENFSMCIGFILKEFGEGSERMDMSQISPLFINPKLQSLKVQISSTLNDYGNHDHHLATLNFLFLEIVDLVEELAKFLQELGQESHCKKTNIDHV